MDIHRCSYGQYFYVFLFFNFQNFIFRIITYKYQLVKAYSFNFKSEDIPKESPTNQMVFVAVYLADR